MSESLKELKVLYVEDEETIREAMARMLNRVVGKLYVAKNGKEGLELYMDAGPDMVVSDIRMPVMDGIEMAKHIKEINFETPIIFTTAFGDSDYLKEVIDMGAQGYLIKPIEKKKLMQKLSFIADAVVNSRRKLSYLKL
ncbi:MAG: response regulator [Hydrogenimonas sp.]|nr:response regulator [Hydrogenimonas sp.]